MDMLRTIADVDGLEFIAKTFEPRTYVVYGESALILHGVQTEHTNRTVELIAMPEAPIFQTILNGMLPSVITVCAPHERRDKLTLLELNDRKKWSVRMLLTSDKHLVDNIDGVNCLSLEGHLEMFRMKIERHDEKDHTGNSFAPLYRGLLAYQIAKIEKFMQLQQEEQENE